MKKIAIMQPYFLPYIGYFQLINLVDEFIIYDNIEFTKKGWINRNRILVNYVDSYISLPLKSDSDFLQVNNRFLADSWVIERKKLLNRIKEAYRKAPYFKDAFEVIEKCILFDDSNLFNFILHSIKVLVDYLGIKTKLIVSSTIPIDHTLKGEEKVISICQSRKTNVYINSIGGMSLYCPLQFKNRGIDLLFLKSNDLIYNQFDNNFIPCLSILDVLMFNSRDLVINYLSNYTILSNNN